MLLDILLAFTERVDFVLCGSCSLLRGELDICLSARVLGAATHQREDHIPFALAIDLVFRESDVA